MRPATSRSTWRRSARMPIPATATSGSVRAEGRRVPLGAAGAAGATRSARRHAGAGRKTEFAKRHEWQGTRDPAAFLSVPAAIEFQREWGWDEVRAGCHALVERFVQESGLAAGGDRVRPDGRGRAAGRHSGRGCSGGSSTSTGSRCRASSTTAAAASASRCRATTRAETSEAHREDDKWSCGTCDAPGRNRTCDLALRRRALYPLSYRRGGLVYRVESAARIVSLELAETFTIARGSQDTADVVEVEIRHDGVVRLRRGGAAGRLRRVGRVGQGVHRGGRAGPRRRPVRARGGDAAAAGRAVRGAGGDRRRAARSLRQAGRRAGLAAARARAHRSADRVDDRARRPRRRWRGRPSAPTRAGGSSD